MAERQTGQGQTREAGRQSEQAGYEALDIDAVEAIYDSVREKFLQLNENYVDALHDGDDRAVNNLERDLPKVGKRLEAIKKALDRKKISSAEEKRASRTPKDIQREEMIKAQIEGIQEAGKTGKIEMTKAEMAEQQLEDTNDVRRGLGLSEYASYDDLWADAQRDRRKFDKADQNKEARRELGEKNKDRAERGETTLNLAEQKELDQKNLDEENKKRKESGQPEITLEQHKAETAKKEAQEKALEKAKEDRTKSPEYQAEQVLRPILDQLDSEISKHEKIYEEYESMGLWTKLKNRESKKSGKKAERLQSVRAELLAEETFFTIKKTELAKGFELLSGRENDIYLINDATNPNRNAGSDEVSLRMSYLTHKIEVLEEMHYGKKDKIMGRLEKYGLNIDDTQQEKVVDLREAGIYSGDLSEEEETWVHMEKSKLDESFFDGKIIDFQDRLDKNARASGAGALEKLNHEIQVEIEKYKRKVLESRLKVKRMLAQIEAETKKENKAEINLGLMKACSKGIREETLVLQKYEKKIKDKVICIGLKNRVSQAIKSKISNIENGSNNIWERAKSYLTDENGGTI